jgi:hypothetical protein
MVRSIWRSEPFDSLVSLRVFDLSIGLEVFEGVEGSFFGWIGVGTGIIGIIPPTVAFGGIPPKSYDGGKGLL